MEDRSTPPALRRTAGKDTHHRTEQILPSRSSPAADLNHPPGGKHSPTTIALVIASRETSACWWTHNKLLSTLVVADEIVLTYSFFLL
jgi:hypothetical protein